MSKKKTTNLDLHDGLSLQNSLQNSLEIDWGVSSKILFFREDKLLFFFF